MDSQKGDQNFDNHPDALTKDLLKLSAISPGPGRGPGHVALAFREAGDGEALLAARLGGATEPEQMSLHYYRYVYIDG